MEKTYTKTSLAIALQSAFIALISTSAIADEQDSESVEHIQVVGSVNKFGALKDDIPLLETARSVSIETADDFAIKGMLTLDDTLVYSSGVVGEMFGFSTRGDFASVRGFDAPEYRDGMQSLSGNYNNTRPELFTLEQVEVLKGPASVLFGPGSPGGIINIVSKRPKAEIENEVQLEVGSFNRTQVAADLSLNNDDNSVMTRFVTLYRDSDTQISQVNDDSFVFAPSVTFTPSDATSISLLGDYTSRKSDTAQQFLPLTGTLLPSASGEKISNTAYLGEPGFNVFDTESWALTLLAEHRLNDTWSLDLSSRYRDGESTYNQTWIAFLGSGVPRIDENGNGARTWYQSRGFSTQFQFDARARATFDLGESMHRILVGVSHQRIENRQDSSRLRGFNFATGMPDGGLINVFNPVYGNQPELPEIQRGQETEDRIFGVYIHDQINWHNWIFNAGVRFDDVSKDQGANAEDADENETSFSASILYQFDNGVSPYFNYSESFQPVFGIDNVTGDALKPESGEQMELGVKWQPTGTQHFITLAAFDIELSNLSNPAALPDAPSQQEGVSEVQGAEIEAFFDWDAVTLELNAMTLDSEEQNGFQRSSIPEKAASAWLSYSPANIEGLTTGLGVRYVGENQSTGANALTGLPLTITTPGYTVFDVAVSYRWSQFEASLNVKNVTDKEYYATCLARGDCFAGEERGVTARFSYHF
ncbi:TonB-dependent siderophore receptor [Alteromonas sp. a30]|uniref:TonB-dependent siderophore receptor n=1 Tax=Alteromonas sp. a30 TaxID=2730917 RepID=UPI00227DBD8C|nr:TonB-dependent siderophore receptor [Alteromonas sp. a30]MCY7297356.1 TonB-dependent siderophore receptor [Alteromonas sp. a30]